MDELIKRSDAKDAVIKQQGLYGAVVDDICERIESIPSADRPQLDKDIVEPIGNGNVIMSEDTYEELLADSPQEWIDKAIDIMDEMKNDGIVSYEQAWEFRMRARMKGADDE